LPVFHPKGGVIKREMEDYVRRRHIEEGFEYVGTPHIAKEGLFYTSGHLPYYGEGMFPPMDVDGMDYRLKAMNCPMHNLIYRSGSARTVNCRCACSSSVTVYRTRSPASIHGLTRVRGFAQDDSHSYVTPEQAPEEIRHLLNFCLGLFATSASTTSISNSRPAMTPSRTSSSARMRTGRWPPRCWPRCLRGVRSRTRARPGWGRLLRAQDLGASARRDRAHLADVDHPVRLQPAFRGRFNLEYVAADGTRKQPVMIHSAKFGSIERFIGVLVEHYAGAFPPWLAPVQVQGIPIAERHADYLHDIAGR
jgi:threonyl-tRNA synthetase